jgi:phosphate transport system substrate-binding protein
MLPLYTHWAEGYKRDHPGVELDLQGGGSELGIAALFAGKVNIASASRPLSGTDLQKFNTKFNALPLELIVGLDALGVYIHEGNPVSWLTMEELRGIFAGEIKNWREVRGVDRRIDVYTRNADSGTYVFFREVVLAGGPYASRSRPPGQHGNRRRNRVA